MEDQDFLKQLRMAVRVGSPVGPPPVDDPTPLPDKALNNLGGMALLVKQLGKELLGSEFPPIRTRYV
jgi:hypothetical protein